MCYFYLLPAHLSPAVVELRCNYGDSKSQKPRWMLKLQCSWWSCREERERRKQGWSGTQRQPLLLAQRLVFLAKSCWLLRVIGPADFRKRNRGVQEKKMISDKKKRKKARRKNKETRTQQEEKSRSLAEDKNNILSVPHPMTLCIHAVFGKDLQQESVVPAFFFAFVIVFLFDVYITWSWSVFISFCLVSPPANESGLTNSSAVWIQDRGRFGIKMIYKQGITFWGLIFMLPIHGAYYCDFEFWDIYK